MSGRQPAGADALTPWFNPPDDGRSGRRALTRERAAAEALTVIDADGARPLSMRAVAARPACSTTGEQLRARTAGEYEPASRAQLRRERSIGPQHGVKWSWL